MNRDTSTALFVLLIAAVGVFLLIFIIAVPAHALECAERPDGKSYWTYRIIDGDRCWYRGHRRVPKSSLHWPDEPKPKKLKGDPVFNQIRADDTIQAPLRSDEPLQIVRNGTAVKIVKPNEYNELDAKAGENFSGPIIMFPEVTGKVDTLLNWWNHRWDDKP